MTFDKSPTGKPIVPHIEGIEDQAIMGQNASSPLQSQTVVEDSEQLDEDFPLPADVGGSIARLKALSGDAVDALDAQRKDIGRVSAAVESIVKDMNHMKGLMASMRSEMYARPAASLGRQDRAVYPVDELELLTANITSIGAKANEVEGLKLELEMMKRRIKRMEDANGAMQSTSTLAALSQETPRQSQMARMTGPLARRSLQKPVKKASLPRDLARDADAYRLGTINAQDELGNRGGSASTSQEGLNDNKRPRSSTLEDIFPDSQQDRAGGGGASSSEHGKSQVNSSDQNMADSAPPPVKTPTERHASKPTEPFFSYQVMDVDNPSDDDYRPGSRSTAGRGTSHSSRGRGRGRGIGRGSKPRKSLTSDRFATPPWEKPDWTAEARTNGESTAVTTSSRRNGEVSRRGTGGGSFSEPRRAQRQDSSDSKELTRDAEGYSLTPDGKRDGGSAARPRDERPRDAEGYLITAKGKRDGRSQFWADVGAGLRPHPKARNQSEPGSTNRHANIMQQIFPNGTEEGRRKSNLAQQLFSHDQVRDGKDE
ncbi:MAG: hypothetical protein M1830_008133 [Pleopsidium flavum]|nr:MAG: hypothetical protein M1830_008133 [Pleopsidium flavum]